MADKIEITASLLDEIEAKARAAAPGSWQAEGCMIFADEPEGRLVIYDEGGHNEADAAYIARMDPPTTLALVARVRELEAVLADRTSIAPMIIKSARLQALADAERAIARCEDEFEAAAAIRALADKEQSK